MNQFYSEHVKQNGYSSVLSFTVTDINNSLTKLMALGAELDGPIKYEIHGKVVSLFIVDFCILNLCSHDKDLKTLLKFVCD